MIITIGSTKGGVGKSTISCNLAVAAANDNKKIFLVDADVQASSMAFRAVREKDDIQAVQITTPTLHKDLSKLNHDFIIIDAGGRDSTTFRSAILAADVLLIPCLPSTFDFWAVKDVLEVLNEAKAFRDDIQAYFILNQVISRTKLADEIVDGIERLKGDVGLLQSTLGSRVIYKNSLATGKGVIEMKDKKAKSEFNNLYQEIKKHRN